MITKPTLTDIDAVMCEADDIYFDMGEAYAAGDFFAAEACGRQLSERYAVMTAMFDRIDGATVH